MEPAKRNAAHRDGVSAMDCGMSLLLHFACLLMVVGGYFEGQRGKCYVDNMQEIMFSRPSSAEVPFHVLYLMQLIALLGGSRGRLSPGHFSTCLDWLCWMCAPAQNRPLVTSWWYLPHTQTPNNWLL